MAAIEELGARFLIGGTVVSAFAVLGNLFKPKSFAGLFGAAPSIALATLVLTVSKDGPSYASIEASSMLVGAIALGFYSFAVVQVLVHGRLSAIISTICCLPVWFAAAFGLWFMFLR